MELNSLDLVGRFVELYDNESEPHKFAVGKLEFVSSEIYVANMIDRLGRADGFQLGFCEDVWAIGISSKYLDLLERPNLSLPETPGQTVDDALAWSVDGNVISFQFADESETFVVVMSFNKSTITLRELDEGSGRVMIIERRGLKRLRGGAREHSILQRYISNSELP